MKKLLIALLLTVTSTAFAEVELDERDSKELYYTLARWGVREADKGDQVTRIHLEDIRCAFRGVNGTGILSQTGCELYDELHNDKLRRSDDTAWKLARILEDHVGSSCENRSNEYCYTGADRIRCWHKWDDKNDRNDHHRRAYFCEIRRIPSN